MRDGGGWYKRSIVCASTHVIYASNAGAPAVRGGRGNGKGAFAELGGWNKEVGKFEPMSPETKQYLEEQGGGVVGEVVCRLQPGPRGEV